MDIDYSSDAMSPGSGDESNECVAPDNTNASFDPGVDGSLSQNLTPQDANASDPLGQPVHVSFDPGAGDTHIITPDNANATDPQGHDVYVPFDPGGVGNAHNDSHNDAPSIGLNPPGNPLTEWVNRIPLTSTQIDWPKLTTEDKIALCLGPHSMGIIPFWHFTPQILSRLGMSELDQEAMLMSIPEVRVEEGALGAAARGIRTIGEFFRSAGRDTELLQAERALVGAAHFEGLRTPDVAPGVVEYGQYRAIDPGVVVEPPAREFPPPEILESSGAAQPPQGATHTDPFSGQTYRDSDVTARAQTSRSLHTGIDAAAAERFVYDHGLERGYIGLSRPGHVNAPGEDCLWARRNASDGHMEIVFGDATLNSNKSPYGNPPQTWIDSADAATQPGTLNLGNGALEAEIREAFNEHRFVVETTLVEVLPTGVRFTPL